MTTTQILAFAAAMALGAISPGPDFAVVVRHSVISGTRGGLATASGVATGVFVWVLAATTGVAALLAASAVAFTVVKVVGAVYLVVLGVKALRAAARGGSPAQAVVAGRSRRAFRSGLLCNLLNPKAAVFFVALMPQFLPARPAVTDVLVLSAAAFVVTLLWFGSVATVMGGLRRLLDRPAVRRAIDGVTGTALVLLGIRLAATRA